MPPHCYVCGLDLADAPDDGRERFTLIYFGETEDAKMQDSRVMARLGRAGHPRNAVWFCTEHVTVAREHENMNARAALDAIDAAVGRERRTRPGGEDATSSRA